jgi:hypothetical protein
MSGDTLVPAPAADALLERARAALVAAGAADAAGERFCLAHLGALRAGAALVAARGRPAASRRRLVSVWLLLGTLAPGFSRWADYFAAGAPVRRAVEAGSRDAVTTRTADDQLRAAIEFCRLVEAELDQLPLPRAG